MPDIPFEVGQIYERQKHLHAPFGGQRQGGISTPNGAPVIFLFTGESGEQYGYHDGWVREGVFRYTGEGQVGDMQFVRGNEAIRTHAEKGKDLLLFEALGKAKGYRYLGNFGCSSWEIRKGKDRLGSTRNVIVFHLVPQGEVHVSTEVGASSLPLDELRQRALAASREVTEKSLGSSRASYYERSEAVKVYVLARASGVCEACKMPAPFARIDGSPYLEPHHTRRLSDGGPDDPRWVAAVCPNCHREVHYGADGAELNQQVQSYLSQIEKVE